MTNLREARIIVVAFTIEGCEACQDFKPRFERQAARYRAQVPVFLVDANDPRYADLASRLNVTNVPATFILRRPTGIIRVEGGIPDSQIAWLFDIAAREAVVTNY